MAQARASGSDHGSRGGGNNTGACGGEWRRRSWQRLGRCFGFEDVFSVVFMEECLWDTCWTIQQAKNLDWAGIFGNLVFILGHTEMNELY
jgi:hypothetical protein